MQSHSAPRLPTRGPAWCYRAPSRPASCRRTWRRWTSATWPTLTSPRRLALTGRPGQPGPGNDPGLAGGRTDLVLHLLILRYPAAMEQAQPHFAAHREYLQRHHTDGTLVLSGQAVPAVSVRGRGRP